MSYQPPTDPQNQPTYTPPQQPYTQYPQTPPPPPYQQSPKPKKRRTWLWVVGILVALIVFYQIGHAAITEPSTSPAATQAPTDTPFPTVALAPTDTPVPTKPPTWTTVQTFRGNGNKKTSNFDVPDSWRIVWTCDPSSSFGGSYNVIVDVYNSDGTSLDLGAINTICSSTNKGDMTEEHQGGTVYLDVQSEGAWVIKVQVLQ